MEESPLAIGEKEEDAHSCSSLSVVDDQSQGDDGGEVMHQMTTGLNDVNESEQEKEKEQSDGSPLSDDGCENMSGIGMDSRNVNDHEEITSVDRAGSVISGLGTCSSVNGESPIDTEISAYSSILLDPDSLPYGKAPSLLNDEKSMQSSSTKPDPPPSVAGDTEMVSLNETSEGRPHRFQEEVEETSSHVEATRENSNTDTTQEESIQQPRDASASTLPPENGSLSKFLESALDDSDDVERTQPVVANLQRSFGEHSATDTNGTLNSSAYVVMPRETGVTVGPDNLQLLPAVEEERLQLPRDFPPYATLQQPHLQQQHTIIPVSALSQQQRGPVTSQLSASSMGATNNDRRKIQFRLQEDVLMKTSHKRSSSLLGSIRKNSTRMLQFGRGDTTSTAAMDGHFPVYKSVDRGTIFVSWYPGTSTLELYQHVRRSVSRKMKNDGSSKEIHDIRILDESSDPPEEIVLSPYIPDGSRFLLRFSLETEEAKNGLATPLSQMSSRPPVSPSAAPSPNPAGRHVINDLNEKQIALLDSLQSSSTRNGVQPRTSTPGTSNVLNGGASREVPPSSALSNEEKENEQGQQGEEKDDMMLHSSDPVESMLREMMDLLVSDKKRNQKSGEARPVHEKRQVIFVVANYFALFICFIFFSAELQARVPGWLKMMEEQLKNVENCSEDQEALFECVSRGDFAGLIASVGLWLSRSVVTKRIFLFGFDTPKKLWTVVYESLVTSICWGISYLFIRRGMNPDTRPRFVQKYWKDAVYGSLAGFNAAFLKQILKNLIPQDVVEDAIRERQLKFLGWFPSFA